MPMLNLNFDFFFFFGATFWLDRQNQPLVTVTNLTITFESASTGIGSEYIGAFQVAIEPGVAVVQ